MSITVNPIGPKIFRLSELGMDTLYLHLAIKDIASLEPCVKVCMTGLHRQLQWGNQSIFSAFLAAAIGLG